jgi:hypothetical protein
MEVSPKVAAQHNGGLYFAIATASHRPQNGKDAPNSQTAMLIFAT